MVAQNTDSLTHLLWLYSRGANVFSDIAKLVEPLIRCRFGRQRRLSQSLDDLCQNTLLRLHRTIDKYDPQRPAIPWVLALARFEAMGLNAKLRSTQTMERSFSSNGHDGANMLEAMPAPERPAEFSPEVWDALMALPRKPREMLCMRFVQFQTYSAIAKAFNCSLSGASSGVYRATLLLKEKCGKSIPATLVRRSQEIGTKEAAKKRQAMRAAKSSTRQPSYEVVDVIEIAQRFRRIYPQLGELNQRLSVMEAILG